MLNVALQIRLTFLLDFRGVGLCVAERSEVETNSGYNGRCS